MNDADIQMAALQRAGDASTRARRAGHCTHGWLRGGDTGPAVCLHCGATFPSLAAAMSAGNEVLSEYR